MYNLIYPTIDKLKENTELYDSWKAKYPTNDLNEYSRYAHKYSEFVFLSGIIVCTLSYENNQINRNFIKMVGTPQDIINKFIEFNDNFVDSNKFYVGYDIQYEFSLIIKNMVKYDVTIPNNFKYYLDMKPWENQFFLDIKYLWKFGDTYGMYSELNDIANFMGFKRAMPITNMSILSQLDVQNNSDRIIREGMNYVNTYAQIMKKIIK